MKILAFVLATIMAVPAGAVEVVKKLNLDNDRVTVMLGGVNEYMSDQITKDLRVLDKKSNKPIWLVIKSPGGSVVAGFQIITAMQATESPIYCVVDSYAFSMAAITTTYCDKVYIQKYARIMFHEASFGVSGSESLVGSSFKHIMHYLYGLHEEVAKNLNIPFGQYRNLIAREWWLTSEEALSSKVADAMVLGLKYSYKTPDEDSLEALFGPATFSQSDSQIMFCGPTFDRADPCFNRYR